MNGLIQQIITSNYYERINNDMPYYSFENIKTGEIEEHLLTFEEYDDFVALNPQLQRTYTKMNLVSGVGEVKTDDLFKDEVLGRIGEHHAGTEMGDRYGKKSAKEVKTRAAVDKWKKKREYDSNK
jgi:hypothetical protein